MLTALLPTRNRPEHCVRQLNFLRGSGFAYRVIVLDASDAAGAADIRAACEGFAEYRHFDPARFRMADKLAAAVVDVATPFVILIPDDDVTLLDAVEAELAFLQAHPDYIAAHGYFLSFAVHEADIDIFDVIGFTPSITNDNPLWRHYDLFRRYQSFYWGVFRTGAFAASVTAACAMKVVLFRELTVMSTAILQGKVARLPQVHALRGITPSHVGRDQSDPLYWTLHDAESFFQNYRIYRDGVASFARRQGVQPPDGVKLEQLLDMSHAAFLGRAVDTGMINYRVQQLLGEPLPPVAAPDAWPGWREPAEGDVVHLGEAGSRRFVWRRCVAEAEPREEIVIDAGEMARVERQLEAYR